MKSLLGFQVFFCFRLVWVFLPSWLAGAYNSSLWSAPWYCPSSYGYIRQVLQVPCRQSRLHLYWRRLSYTLHSCSFCPVSFPIVPTYLVCPLLSAPCGNSYVAHLRFIYVSPTSAVRYPQVHTFVCTVTLFGPSAHLHSFFLETAYYGFCWLLTVRCYYG